MARETIARRRSARGSAADDHDATEAAENTGRSTRRGRGGQPEAPADEETGRRRPRSERAAEEAPAPRREPRKGWGVAREAQSKASSGKYDDGAEFKVAEVDERYLLKVMDEPFETAFEHWLDKATGRKSWSCEETKECPLCAIGDEPKPFSYINVIDLNSFDKNDELLPEAKYWKLSADPLARLSERAEELEDKGKSLADDDVYIVVRKTKGKKRGFSYSVDVVRSGDSSFEDWEMQPLTEDELDDLSREGFDESVIRVDKHSELRERAREMDTG